jgi:hypothetical protein
MDVDLLFRAASVMETSIEHDNRLTLLKTNFQLREQSQPTILPM